MPNDAIPKAWCTVLERVLATPKALELDDFLRTREGEGARIFPPVGQRLTALALVPPEAVKVVILGQDPYHGAGQAHGLAFSVQPGARIPPSLVNIYKEMASDLDLPLAKHGDLRSWARQGVLLLNNALTVEEGRAGSHQNMGWEAITDAIIEAVAKGPNPCAFMLWGRHAQKKAARIDALKDSRHLLLKAPHPSPLSAYNGFFGSRPFSQANVFLQQHGRTPVDWMLPPA